MIKEYLNAFYICQLITRGNNKGKKLQKEVGTFSGGDISTRGVNPL
jgi:hypothetical protein